MDYIYVYGQDHCPKCNALKSFLEDLGVPFKSLDMAEHMDYLDAREGFPPDAGAPTMEYRDPTGRGLPLFWTHNELFESGKLDTGLVEKIIGIQLVTEWE